MHFARPHWARWARWTNSLAARLLLSHLAVLLLVGALGVFGPMVVLRWNPVGLTTAVLLEESRLLLDGMRHGTDGRPSHIELPAETAWLFHALPEDFLYRVVDAQGRVLLSSQPGGAALAPAGQAFDGGRARFEIDVHGVSLSVSAMPLERAGQRWTVQVAASQRLIKLTRLGVGSTYVRAALVPLTILLLVVSGVIVWTLRRMVRPLREVSQAAGHIAPDALQVRLDPRLLPTEVLPLIDAFNLALDRLERGFVVQQEFLGTAAHELKTPLALIRAQLEGDGYAADSPLLADVDGMTRQVQQLLHLVEVSEAQNFCFEPVDLHAVVREAVAYMERLAARTGVRLHLVCGSPAAARTRVRADRSALFILMKNLIENAIQHAPRGGHVQVALEADHVCVSDQGAGIAATDLPHLFDRFWRGSTRRHSGAGLGLTICRAVAQAHGWPLQAASPGPGRGATFTLRILSV